MTTTKIVEVGIKLYLNGFPKSGTHLLDSLALCVMRQANKDDNWMGNVGNDGFGCNFIHEEGGKYPKLTIYKSNETISEWNTCKPHQ